MRFWRSDDQRIQWLAAKFGNYLVDANARFAASSKWRSVMSISTLVNAIDNLAKEKSPNMFPLVSSPTRATCGACDLTNAAMVSGSALDLSFPIDDANRCQLQRYVQSDIVLHCSPP
jgi:hypothetical protein